MSPGITCESSRSLPGNKDEKMMHKSTGNTNKLSFGPNTFVGIAEVKLQSNSSLYALSVGYIVISSFQSRRNALALDIDHTLRVRITIVTLMRWSTVDLGFVQREFDHVGKTHVDRHETTFCTLRSYET